jgi:hypothetical protein
MSGRPRRTWFPAKRYGWGWGAPVTWQGWCVLLAYAGVVAAAIRLLTDRHPWAFGAVVGGATLGLLAVCWCKGERPGWRRGGR